MIHITKIRNANIFCDDGDFRYGELTIEDGLFKRVVYSSYASAPDSGERVRGAGADDDGIDADGCYAIPGLIDIHLHGCAGYNFYEADAAELKKMLRYQAENGVTAVCPTTLTLPEADLERACGRIASYIEDDAAYPPGSAGARDRDAAARMLGVYLEGPFISPGRTGAQNPAHTAPPNAAMYDRLRAASGDRVKIIALAPEIDGALEFIEYAAKSAIVSVAHTNADYDAAEAAFKRGASHVTHLYNAMPPLTHRAPNVIGAAFDAPGVTAEIVCDGVHLHPSAARAAMKLFGADRIVIVSDSMMAAGLGDGLYDLGGLSVRVTGKEARLVEGGNIASSVSNLMDCLRVAVRDVGATLADAVRYTSVNPARVMGVCDTRGRVSEGCVADLVLLDAGLNIRKVFVGGEPI